MLVEHDRLVRRREIGVGLGDTGFGLLELCLRVEAGSNALLNELQGLRADIERALEIVTLRIKRSEIGVGRGNSRGEREPRFLLVIERRLGVLPGGPERGPVLAPQVEVEGEADGQRAVIVPAALHRQAGIAALFLLDSRGCRIDRRQERRTGLLRETLSAVTVGSFSPRFRK